MNDRIRMAFARPSALTDRDIVEMQRRCIKDSNEWKRRKRREENAGGFDEEELARQRKYASRRAELRRAAKAAEASPAWANRVLSDDEKARLKAAWGN